MQGGSYKKYMSLGKDRVKYVQEQVQEPSSQLHPIKQTYSEENFIELYGSQDKKAFKIATFRQINKTEQPKGVIVIFHDLGLHTGTTATLAHRLSEEGFVCVAYDQRGHGKSAGQRGYIDDIKEVVKDSYNFLKKIVQMYPKLPLFYFGHGMGGAMALLMAQQKKQFKVSGIIIGNPSLKKPQNSKVISALSDFALKLMPNRAGLFAFNFDNTTRNPSASKLLKQDPLVYHDKVFVRTLQQLQEMMGTIEEDKWGKMRFPPLVVIQGELDRVADAINAIKFYEALPQKEKEMWYYEKMWHMLFYEKEYPEIQGRIVNWFKAQVKG